MIDEKKLIDELDRKLYAMQIVPMSAVLDIIKEQPKVGEWIPCSERLPEEKGTYLVTVKKFGVTFARFTGQKDNLHFDSEVIAWMPLPEPFKEGGAV